MEDQIKIAASEMYKIWLLTRHLVKSSVPELSNNKVSSGVPSFIAANNLLETNHGSITRAAFTPTIPYLVTEYDTINTAMINFQDVLLLKGLACGPLWSNEGVYRIAKELQFLQPIKFGIIFSGID